MPGVGRQEQTDRPRGLAGHQDMAGVPLLARDAMEVLPELNVQYPSLRLAPHLLDRTKLQRFVELYPATAGASIVDFGPKRGQAGTMMIIVGHGFAEERHDNQVEVGGVPAQVVASDANRLVVLTAPETHSGPVMVSALGSTAAGPVDFELKAWPTPDSGLDGPPFSYRGSGAVPGSVPPTGTARILVVACHPADAAPPNPASDRQAIVDTFDQVNDFYTQASYGRLAVQVEVTTFVPLLRDTDYYHRDNGGRGYPNIDLAVLDQLMAECAQGAVNQGLDLDDYQVLVASVFMPGRAVRAWGGWSRSNFAYNDGAGTSIDITTTHPLSLIAQRHDADWGRAAHEFGHALIDGGLVLPEDVYGSDLVDTGEASAENFEMMGNHDTHPLFSGFLMHQLGWYTGANIRELNWDRNPFSQEFDLVAHGTAENTDPARCHLLRIRVTEGLSYFVEVRQRPDAASPAGQVFDAHIPLYMNNNPDGGVVVTRVITGTLNNNHQTRLITLLQEQRRTMVAGEEAGDPLRTLRVTVVNDAVHTRPRVCRVRVEWAQTVADTPGGDFDLNIEPWGPGWESRDIWIDRLPYGTFDFVDAAGNPTGNGDVPRVMEINRFQARIHNDGTADADNVRVTHYAISPPGVGDNGNWSPLATNTLRRIAANATAVSTTNWVPQIGEHTCLKVAISQQLGEVTGDNNSAQENVATFRPAAGSVPEPVLLTLAVRNPLTERSLVLLGVEGVPPGYQVYLPHRWLYLDGLAERKLDLLVVPHEDFKSFDYQPAPISILGWIPRVYEEKLDVTGPPASWMAPIGGFLAHVMPQRRGTIKLSEPTERGRQAVTITGEVDPAFRDQAVRVDMTRPDDTIAVAQTKTDAAGHFTARFSRVDDRGAALPGVYGFQAHLISASRIAPADSNIVWLVPKHDE